MWISTNAIFFVQKQLHRALLHYFFKYRGKAGQTYFADNNKLEFIWSSIPAIVLAVLIFYGCMLGRISCLLMKKKKKPIVIDCTHNSSNGLLDILEDDVLGKANVRYIEGINSLGVDLSDPNAQDDKVTDELHIPKGKKSIIQNAFSRCIAFCLHTTFRAQMNCVRYGYKVCFYAFDDNRRMRETPNGRKGF
jgi:cytochrome c oxidase subunit 2